MVEIPRPQLNGDLSLLQKVLNEGARYKRSGGSTITIYMVNPAQLTGKEKCTFAADCQDKPVIVQDWIDHAHRRTISAFCENHRTKGTNLFDAMTDDIG